MTTEKFKNKYRIPSARLQNWDYGRDGAYFVTICTHHRAHFFGQIVETRFIASPAGETAMKRWYEIPEHFPYVRLDAFVVMPNHVHGIIIIQKKEEEGGFSRDGDQESGGGAINQESGGGAINQGSGGNGGKTGGKTCENNPMLQENLSRILRWYKGRTAFESRKINPDFAWQTRFHDHIIRNNQSFLRIRNYIINNPSNWKADKFH